MTIERGGRDSPKKRKQEVNTSYYLNQNIPREHTNSQKSGEGLIRFGHIRCAGERASEEERGVPPPAARAPLRLLISAAENAPTKNNGDSGAAAVVFAQPLGKAVGSLF